MRAIGGKDDETHVLFHDDSTTSARGEIHEEVRLLGNGDIVLEAWFFDSSYPADEEMFRLLIPATQRDRFLAALNAGRRSVHGSDIEDVDDPVAALKSLPIFDFRAGVYGVERLRWWLDGTSVEYEWTQEDVKGRHDCSYRKGPSPVTELPPKVGDSGARQTDPR